jgi:hypothetical protein
METDASERNRSAVVRWSAGIQADDEGRAG